MRRLESPPWAVIVALALAASGCFTIGIRDAMFSYYRSGPELALDLMDYAAVAPGDWPLVARERAMFSLEPGWYADTVSELEPVLRQLEQDPRASWLDVRDEDGVFLGESYERAAVPMLMLATRLALQDPERAAACADRVLLLNRALGGPQYSPSTWVLASLAYEAAERPGAAGTTLDELLWSTPPELAEHAAEAVQYLRTADPRQRSLVVILMLGPGPFKRKHEIRLGDGELLSWAVYDPEDEPSPLSTELRMAGAEPVSSVVVEDLWHTARHSLAERYDRVLASVVEDADNPEREVQRLLARSSEVSSSLRAAFAEPQELLGWWSLPATVHILRMPVPDDFRECSLLIRDQDGELVSEELISVTEGWPDGPLFVVRRIP